MDFNDPTFWVAVAFVIFLLATIKPLSKALTAALDGRVERIRMQLDEAQSLREEAQKTLAEYKRKQRDAEAEATKMIQHATEEAQRIRQQAESDLETALARRAEQAEEKIQQAEATALKDVRNQAVDLAMTATAKLLAEKIDKTKDKTLIDQSIEDVSSKLN